MLLLTVQRANCKNILTKGTQINHFVMTYFNWNNEKNDQLKRKRNISFERIVTQIENGKLCILSPICSGRH